MDKQNLIKQTAKFVEEQMKGEGSGHDWWHVWRVWQLSKKIGKKEKANLLVVEIAALLHDISDWKFNDGDLTIGGRVATKWLKKIKASESLIKEVVDILNKCSFKGSYVKDDVLSLEGQIVQDADRLDAIGAIGIARTFAYGGHQQREIYNPKIKVKMSKNFKEYQKSGETTINHFYEKLLLVKNRMNTQTGKKIAQKRHKFLEVYLKEFFDEWPKL